MDDWEKFYETALLEKEHFCSHLNMEDFTDADYTCANFRNMCLEIYEPDTAKVLSAPGLA